LFWKCIKYCFWKCFLFKNIWKKYIFYFFLNLSLTLTYLNNKIIIFISQKLLIFFLMGALDDARQRWVKRNSCPSTPPLIDFSYAKTNTTFSPYCQIQSWSSSVLCTVWWHGNERYLTRAAAAMQMCDCPFLRLDLGPTKVKGTLFYIPWPLWLFFRDITTLYFFFSRFTIPY
jgi:hypothetical protein